MSKFHKVTLSSGVAVGGTASNQDGPFRGKIKRISIKYDSGSGANTRVAIWGGTASTDVADQDAEGYLIVKGNTDKVYYPRHIETDETGEFNTVIYENNKDVHDCFINFTNIHIKILNATEGKGVTAELLIERD